MLHLRLTQNRQHVKCGQPSTLFALLDISPDDSTRVIPRRHHVALVIDCSGSMDGKKLEDAKDSALDVAGSLAPGDLVSVVTFESDARVQLDPTPAEHRDVEKAIRSIRVGGGTAMHKGMSEGSRLLGQTVMPDMTGRLELFTDGMPNVEPYDDGSFERLASEISRAGITVDTFGIGDDYNESLLMKIAEIGRGKWQHVSDTSALTRMVKTQITEMQNTVMLSPQLQITLMPGAEISKIAVTKPVLLDLDPKMMTVSGNTTYIKLKDVIKDESQAVAMRIRVPALEGGQEKSMLTASVVGGESKVAEQTAYVSCTGDMELYNTEIDPNPRVIFSSSEATILLRRGLDGDSKAMEVADTILANIADPETMKMLDDDAQTTVINAKKISGEVQGGVPESDLKRVRYDSTVISKKRQEGEG